MMLENVEVISFYTLLDILANIHAYWAYKQIFISINGVQIYI